MAIELIAAIVAAITLGLLTWALRRKLGERMPKWSVPFAAAVGLIGFTVWSEYDWFSRVSAELPAGIEVVWQAEEAHPLRPWTFLVPITTRFMALNLREVAVHPVVPTLRVMQVYSFARWQPVREAMMAVDCGSGRRVMLTQGATISPEGALTGAEWDPAVDGDTVQAAACREM